MLPSTAHIPLASTRKRWAGRAFGARPRERCSGFKTAAVGREGNSWQPHARAGPGQGEPTLQRAAPAPGPSPLRATPLPRAPPPGRAPRPPPAHLEDLLDGVHQLRAHPVAGQQRHLEGGRRGLGALRLQQSERASGWAGRLLRRPAAPPPDGRTDGLTWGRPCRSAAEQRRPRHGTPVPWRRSRCGEAVKGRGAGQVAPLPALTPTAAARTPHSAAILRSHNAPRARAGRVPSLQRRLPGERRPATHATPTRPRPQRPRIPRPARGVAPARARPSSWQPLERGAPLKASAGPADSGALAKGRHRHRGRAQKQLQVSASDAS